MKKPTIREKCRQGPAPFLGIAMMVIVFAVISLSPRWIYANDRVQMGGSQDQNPCFERVEFDTESQISRSAVILEIDMGFLDRKPLFSTIKIQHNSIQGKKPWFESVEFDTGSQISGTAEALLEVDMGLLEPTLSSIQSQHKDCTCRTNGPVLFQGNRRFHPIEFIGSSFDFSRWFFTTQLAALGGADVDIVII